LSPGSVVVGRRVGEEIVEGPKGRGEGLQAGALGGAEVGEEIGGGVVGIGVAEAGVNAGGELGSSPNPLVAGSMTCSLGDGIPDELGHSSRASTIRKMGG